MNHSISEPVVACLHLVLGGTSQVRTGQRNGCKPFLNRKNSDSIIVREGEFLVSSRGFHKTRTVVLERTSLSDAPVVHAVWVWKGKPPVALVGSVALWEAMDSTTEHEALQLPKAFAFLPSLRGRSDDPCSLTPSVTISRPYSFVS